MDLDGIDYDDLLFILKKQKYREWLKYQEIKPESEMKIQENASEWLKYQEFKYELEMKIQENTYREMLLLLKLIKPNCLPCKINLRHLPSDAFMKKTV
jgi:hypothetical protein